MCDAFRWCERAAVFIIGDECNENISRTKRDTDSSKKQCLQAVFESVCKLGVLTNEDISNWLQAFDYQYDRNAGAYPQVFYSHINRRHFLRCIYFILRSLDGFEKVIEHFGDILQRVTDRS